MLVLIIFSTLFALFGLITLGTRLAQTKKERY